MYKKKNIENILLLVLGILILSLFITAYCLISTYSYAEQEQETKFEQEINDKIATPEQIQQVEQAKAKAKQEQEEAIKQAQKPKMINEGYTQTLNKSNGVYYYNGHRETYYSSRVLYHYRTGEWWADANGFYRTQEGYFVVASGEYKQGTIINISMGQAQVLDAGCATGTIDVYVNW